MASTIERVDIFAVADAHFKLLQPSLQTQYGHPGIQIAQMVLQSFSQSLSDNHVILLAPVETEIRHQETVVKEQVHDEIDEQVLEEMRAREYAEAQVRLQKAAREKAAMEWVEKQQIASRQQFPPVEEATDPELEQLEAEVEGGYEPEPAPRRFSPAELAAAERQKMEEEAKAKSVLPQASVTQPASVSKTEDRPTALLDKLRAYKAGIRGGK